MKNLEISNKMTENDKIKYEAPSMEVIEIESEGMLCASGMGNDAEGDHWGGSWGGDW